MVIRPLNKQFILLWSTLDRWNPFYRTAFVYILPYFSSAHSGNGSYYFPCFWSSVYPRIPCRIFLSLMHVHSISCHYPISFHIHTLAFMQQVFFLVFASILFLSCSCFKLVTHALFLSFLTENLKKYHSCPEFMRRSQSYMDNYKRG